jgi:hypothetical protein
MGTRGVIGTLHDKVLHASYQQFDTYPTSTGVELQKEMRETLDLVEHDQTALSFLDHENPESLFDYLAPLVGNMTYVDADKHPTEEQAEKYSQFLNSNVSTGDDWYSQLREQQGSLMKRLRSGIATEDTAFIKDSLFCEWGYIFDLDDRKVIILRGFNNHEDKQWAHARLSPSEVKGQKDKAKRHSDGSVYYGCSALWTGTMTEFLAVDMKDVEALEVDA